MKKLVTKVLPWIILAAMFVTLIPGLMLRTESEDINKNVTISLLYNDIAQKVSQNKLNEVLDECLDMGVDVITLQEEDINTLVNRGDVTSIKYNVLRHKYDDESIRVAKFIEENCPNISYDSHVVLVKEKDGNNIKDRIKKAFSQRYSDEEYMALGEVENMDIYVFYDGRFGLFHFSAGFNEADMKNLTERGFRLALSVKIMNHENTEYLDELARLVKTYNVDFINIRSDSRAYLSEDIIKENYKKVIDIINENDLTLVVTENLDQLSNEMPTGYQDIYNGVMGENGTKKVVRAYETYDDINIDDTSYMHRVTQYFNSTIDRNVRFITGTQIAIRGIYNLTYDDCADRTLDALREYKKLVEEQGFTVNQQPKAFEYTANLRLNSAAAAVIMIMAVLIMLGFITGKNNFKLSIAAYIISALAFVGTLTVVPASLVMLYPSVYCLVQSCFVMTLVMWYVNKVKDKMHELPLAISTLAITVVSLLIGACGLATLLSGMDYYINNLIFRGIKFSLTVPVVFTAIVFCIMFVRTKDNQNKVPLLVSARKVLLTEIKLYWVLIAALIGGIGYYYILRSGNVNTISSLEQLMRTTLTDIFAARPRTKEFLIGYPALVLFAYYMKKIDIKLFQWLLAIAASILTASVTNSFCHVFTDFSTIVSRTINGLIVGVIVSVIAYVANLILVKIVRKCYSIILPYLEMK